MNTKNYLSLLLAGIISSSALATSSFAATNDNILLKKGLFTQNKLDTNIPIQNNHIPSADISAFIDDALPVLVAANLPVLVDYALPVLVEDPSPVIVEGDSPTYDEDEATYIVRVTSPTGINFREGPYLDSDIMMVLPRGSVLNLLEKGEYWHRVTFNDYSGYVFRDFVTIQRSTNVAGDADSLAYEIVEFARQHLGLRYVFGGTSLTNGVDCSGFVFSIFGHFGIQLGRSSRDQILNGTRIERHELQVGDLVFFNTSGAGVSHVGIYIGGNQMIHSESGRVSRVSISSLSMPYWNARYVGATRVV